MRANAPQGRPWARRHRARRSPADQRALVEGRRAAAGPSLLQQWRACTAKRSTGLADHPRDAARRLGTGTAQKLLRSSNRKKGAPAGGRARRCAAKGHGSLVRRRATGPLLRCRPLPLLWGIESPCGPASGQTKSGGSSIASGHTRAQSRTRAARQASESESRPGNQASSDSGIRYSSPLLPLAVRSPEVIAKPPALEMQSCPSPARPFRAAARRLPR